LAYGICAFLDGLVDGRLTGLVTDDDADCVPAGAGVALADDHPGASSSGIGASAFGFVQQPPPGNHQQDQADQNAYPADRREPAHPARGGHAVTPWPDSTALT
jgi:hypothetical protein